MDLHSRERALLVRLCRALGPTYAVLGALLAITVTSQVNGSIGVAVGALFMVPGITLWMASTMIRLGSRGWCVGAIVAGFFDAGLMLLGAAGSVLAALGGSESGSMLALGFAQLLLGILTCVMLYYAFRVLSTRSWYSGDESSITDLRTVVAKQAVHGPQPAGGHYRCDDQYAAAGCLGSGRRLCTLACPHSRPSAARDPSARTTIAAGRAV